jgi:pimeloyl-ACP methyl ester carboxylesterase
MVQDHYITLRDMQFHYREWSRNGTPLILLHGLASQSHIFDLVAPLLAKNFRVITFDQRGHGESTKPDDGYDFETVAQDLVAFLDALNIKRAIIAGHSWGGNVALYFAAHHPDRTRAIVLIDGGFLDIQANSEMTWERTQVELAPPNLMGTPVETFKQRIKQFAGKLWKPSIETIVLQNFEIQNDNTIRPRLSYERHMKILRSLWEQRPREFYPHIQCPALLLPAEMPDENNHTWLERRRMQVEHAAREIQHNRLVWFHDTIHDIPLQRPRKLANAITRFAMDYKLVRPKHT